MKTHTAALLTVAMLIASALPVSYAAEARERSLDRNEIRERLFDHAAADTPRLTEADRTRDAEISSSDDRRGRAVRASIELYERYREQQERDTDTDGAEDTSASVGESAPADDPVPKPEEEQEELVPLTTSEEPTEDAEPIAETVPEVPATEPEQEVPATEPEEPAEDPGPVETEPETLIEEESGPEPEPEPVTEEPAEEPAAEEETDAEPNSYLEAIAREIRRLTNIERERAGVVPLQNHGALAAIAEGHSEDMAAQGYFSHTAPDGCTVSCRFEEAGYDAQAWGENIAWRSSSVLPSAAELAARFVDGWMNSDGHRRNMLSDSFTHEGVGIARNGDRVYATVNFADPR